MSTKYESPEQRYSYRSPLIDKLRANDYEFDHGRLKVRLARNFGFCWGVDRAVAMVWDALHEHPGRQIWLLNQIIHNPKVNQDFRQQGVRFVFGPYADGNGFDSVEAEDLVVIPAFSAEVEHTDRMKEIGCEVLDTTCPWVEKPHRRVLKNLDDGLTVLIHGLRHHDETRATCSLILSRQGHFLVVRDMEDARFLCDYLRGGASDQDFHARFSENYSPNFDPRRDLQRVGIINQTTMLASESREIASLVGEVITDLDRQGMEFRDFDTICPATQDNQDAVMQLTVDDRPDVFLVLGGYDSSNTRNLLRAADARSGSYHLQDPASIQPGFIRHRDPSTGEESQVDDWLPQGNLIVALSAGASTPDTELEEVIRQLCIAAGDPLPERSQDEAVA